jgi:hypothetical protein
MIAKLAAALALLTLAATPSPEHFRYQRAVNHLPAAGGPSCAVLDSAVFAHAAAGLADLRLYASGQETPYVVRAATVPTGNTALTVEPFNKGERNGHTSFDAEMLRAGYSDVELEIHAQDFIATVTVWGSQENDGKNATRLGVYTVFDLTHQRLGRSMVLHLPRSDFPHLHFEVAGPIHPEQVTAVEMNWAADAAPKYTAVATTSAVARDGKKSVVSFTLPAHVPVDRVRIVPGAQPAQFSRPVTVEVAPAAPSKTGEPVVAPITVAPIQEAGSLIRVHTVENGLKLDREQLTLDAPQSYAVGPTRWTVTVDNGDDAPLPIVEVRLEMLERRVCFEAVAGGQATLVYGDPALETPSYDYARLFVENPQAALAVLGPEQANPMYKPRPDERAFTEKHPLLLWVGLIAAVAALGWIAFRSLPAAKPQP